MLEQLHSLNSRFAALDKRLRAAILIGGTFLIYLLALQLPGSFRIAGSGAVNPTRLGDGDPESTHFSVTLERVLSSRDELKGVFFLGFRSGANHTHSDPRHENLLLAGLSRPW